MKRNGLYATLVLWILSSMPAFAQSIDSSSILKHIIDPFRNRLFAMSTGELARTGSLYVSMHELVAYQAGYVPVDFLQVNLMSNLMYRSFGVKIKAFEESSERPAVAFGFEAAAPSSFSDHPNSTIYALNIAGTYTINQTKIHINFLQPIDRQHTSRTNVPTFIQLGWEYSKDTSEARETKFMAEVLLVNKYESDLYELHSKRFGLDGFIIGGRNFGSVFAFELGWVMDISRVPFIGTSDAEFKLPNGPYFSAMWSW